MSKFDELCQAANKSLVEINRLRNQCKQFGADFIKGFVDYLECPPGRATHVLLDRSTNPPGVKPVRFMDSATILDDERWWHTGLSLDLKLVPPGSEHPLTALGIVGRTVALNVHYKRVKDRYLVQFGQDTTQFVVHPGDQQESSAAYQHFFATLKDYFEKAAERFVDPNTEKRLGFL